MKKVSILIPCYNECQNIQPLYDEISRVIEKLKQYQWELLFVDDGSTDDTLSHIKQLRENDKRVCFVSLSRNFGKENAMLAGFDNASGDCVITMDADLQHSPTIIPEMLSHWENGYDDVYAKRKNRNEEGWLRRSLTSLYYKALQRMAKIEILPNVGDFRLLDRKCVKALRNLRETQRYTKALYCWIGYKKKAVEYEAAVRATGKSTFSYRKLFNLAIEGITSYTTAPLRISTVTGLLVSFVAFLYMCFVLLKTLIVGEPVQGYPTLIIVILFLGGLQLLTIGIIGEYLGRIFHETKHRPVYLIDEKSEE